MHYIPENEIPLHQEVVRASYLTYLQLRNQGLEVTPNPLVATKRFVGGENNKIYPDIIAWKPKYLGSSEGVAILIEQIETPGSMVLNARTDWIRLSNLGINFTLVVPLEWLGIAQDLLRQYSIRINRLQTFQRQERTNNFIFSDVRI